MQPVANSQSKRRYQVVAQEKSEGATYTPTSLANFVASKIIDSANLPDKEIRILDPAIGDGELLLSLLTKLVRTASRISVYGFDTDAAAIAIARQRLTSTFPKVELHLECGNFLNFVLNRPSAHRTPSLFERFGANSGI